MFHRVLMMPMMAMNDCDDGNANDGEMMNDDQDAADDDAHVDGLFFINICLELPRRES